MRKKIRSVASFTLAIAMCISSALAGYYNPHVDYSSLLSNPDLTPEMRAQLEQERANKIADMYDGEEPPLAGGSGATFSQNYGDPDGDGVNTFAGPQRNDPNLTETQQHVVDNMIQAALNGTISSTAALDVYETISAANHNGVLIPAASPSIQTYLDVMGYDNNTNNRRQAVTAMMGAYDTVTLADGTELPLDMSNPLRGGQLIEGGIVYRQDANGNWVPDDRYEPEPDAVIMSSEDLAAILQAKIQYGNATTKAEQDAAHAAAEAIRDKYGYTGGHDGGFVNKDGFGTGGGGYTPTPAPTPTPPPIQIGDAFYYVDASAGTGGSISPAGRTRVKEGGSQSYTVTANAGYTIYGIFIDGVSIGTGGGYKFTNIKGNHTIEAVFVKTPPGQFTITASAGPNGSISPSGAVSAAKGSNATFTMTPAAGYKVKDVVVDGTSVGAVKSYTFSNITKDHTISVSFRQKGTITNIKTITMNSSGKTSNTKSGYGIGCEVIPETVNATVTSVKAKNTATGHIYDLELVDGKWMLPPNPTSKIGARVDYLPIKLADGEYKYLISITAKDIYDGTKITKTAEITYTVEGTMYEDDFTGSRR